MPSIALRHADWRAEVAPAIGGSILSLSRGERAILRPTPADAVARGEVRRTACYPLLPYANRIADGRFRVDGREYALRANFPDSAHPLHGVGWQRAWQVAWVGENACELALRHRPVGEDALDWPFAFDATESLSLGPDGLTLALAITNRADMPVPFGLGLHPYFPRAGVQTLRFAAAGAWQNGADSLPVEQVGGPQWDHAAGRRIGADALDNDFFGWSGEARVAAADGVEVRLTATAAFGVLRVFTPAGRDFFCVEPVTHIADAINRPELAVGGITRLAPGERLAGTVKIDASLGA